MRSRRELRASARQSSTPTSWASRVHPHEPAHADDTGVLSVPPPVPDPLPKQPALGAGLAVVTGSALALARRRNDGKGNMEE